MNTFWRVRGRNIVDAQGNPVHLKGVNLGGWLMMEGYIMHAPNVAVQVFKKHFAREHGLQSLHSFEEAFNHNFIREDDIKRISQWGMNCLRIPFNSRLLEIEPFTYSLDNFQYLDKVINWCKKYKLVAILDMHAACGAQNHDWHSDSLGKADLWSKKNLQKRTLALWQIVAERYKNNPTVIGYDLLNESVVNDSKVLNDFYRRIIRTIRHVDQKSILFIEGNVWAQDIECLDQFDDDNYALSIHSYAPLEMTFNFIPHLRYPLRSSKGVWDKLTMKQHLAKYNKISKERNVPIFLGEFGVNYRQNLYGEVDWLDDMLSFCEDFQFHWTYWTYKAIKNSCFPDGIMSYYANPVWINRAGPKMGWDTYATHWAKHAKDIVASWRSTEYRENEEIVSTLSHWARK